MHTHRSTFSRLARLFRFQLLLWPLLLTAFAETVEDPNHGDNNKDPEPPCPPLLPSFDESSGMRFRRIALNGVPMSAEKEQAKEESDETNEETYVDSLTLQLRHDTSDIYVPLPGGELSLAVKRSFANEVWNENPASAYGDNPDAHLNFDKPFGYGWSSGIGATLRVESYSVTANASACPSPMPQAYVYATDEGGASYRFARASFVSKSIDDPSEGIADTEADTDSGKYRAAFLPLPSNRTEKSAFFNRLVAEYEPVSGGQKVAKYVLTRKFGTKLTYEGTTTKAISIKLDSEGKTIKSTYYHRLLSAEDRFGNKLEYDYGAGNSLIPVAIKVMIGGTMSRQIQITRNSAGNRVTSIKDPSLNTWTYNYGTFKVGRHDLPVLQSVKGPDGTLTSYAYEKDSAIDNSLRSPDATEPRDIYYHFNLKSITSNQNQNGSIAGLDGSTITWPSGNARTTIFAYEWDETTYVPGSYLWEDVYTIGSYNPWPSRPKLVRTVNLGKDASGTDVAASFKPLNGTPGYAYVSLSTTFQSGTTRRDEVTVTGARVAEITDAAGKKRIVTYDEVERIDGRELEEFLYPGSGGSKSPFLMILWTKCSIKHPDNISESVEFDIDAGLADKEVTDYSGNVTEYEYADTFKFTWALRAAGWGAFLDDPGRAGLTARLDSLKLLNGRYNDPTLERRSVTLVPGSGPVTVEKAYKYYSSGSTNPLDHAKPGSRVMTELTDAAGKKTQYVVDSDTGNRTAELLYDASSNVVRTTAYTYDAAFLGFVTQETVLDAIYNNGSTTHRVTAREPDAYGNLKKEIIDPSGLAITTQHAYDANGNRLTTTDPRGKVTSFTYDSRNRLTRTTFPDTGSGAKTQDTVYSPNGRKLVTRNENGNLAFFKYDKLDRLIQTIVDMNGLDVTGLGAASADDLVSSTTYNSLGLPLDKTDARGTITRTVYDDLMRPVAVTVDPGGLALTSQLHYDGPNAGATAFNASGFKPTRSVDPRGYETIVSYDEFYRPVKTRKQYQLSPALYAVSTQAYDIVGNPVVSTAYRVEGDDATARVTYTSYDGQNRPIAVTDGFGSVIAATSQTLYTSTTAYQAIDPLGRVTETDFDGAGRAVKVWSPDPSTGAVNRSTPSSPTTGSPCVTTEYDAAGNATKTIDPLGREVVFTYDNRNRKLAQTGPSHTYNLPGGGTSTINPVTSSTYDSVGNVLTVTDPRGTVTTTAYDKANRAIQVKAATGLPEEAVTNTTYDKGGNVVVVQDANGNSTCNKYDAASRMTHTAVNPVTGAPAVDPASPGTNDIVVTNTYDASGNLILVTDGEGQQTAFSYDGLSRKKSTVWDPGKSSQETEAAVYDGLVQISKTDARGYVTGFTYDLRLRKSSEVYSSTPDPVPSEVDAYDLVGNILSVTYPADTSDNQTLRNVSYTYDKLNRAVSEISAGLTHQSAFDKKGNRLLVTYGGTGRKLVSRYDSWDRLVTCWDTTGTVSNPSSYTGVAGDARTDYLYDASGNITGKWLPNGQKTLGSFDPLNRILVLETKDTANDPVVKVDYSQPASGSALPSGYDKVGNVCLFRETKPASPIADEYVRVVANAYDHTNRLDVEIDRSTDKISGSTRAYTERSLYYSYDNANNRTRLREYNYSANVGTSFVIPTSAAVAQYEYNRLVIDETDFAPLEDGSAFYLWSTPSPAPAGDPVKFREHIYGDGSDPAWASNQLCYVAEHDFNTLDGGLSVMGYGGGNRGGVYRFDGTYREYSYDVKNRLIAIDKYDASEEVLSYRYAYDYRTRRTYRSEIGDAAYLTFSGGLSVQEYEYTGTFPGTLKAETIRGSDLGGGIGGVLYSRRGGDASFNAYNSRGDVVAQTDDSGDLTWQASYEGFGTRPVEEGTNLDRQRANTKDEDPTGLLNEGMRYRDLDTGVFLTRDPLGFADGPNVYTYVRQNPWTFFDPLGLDPAFAPGIGMFSSLNTERHEQAARDGAKVGIPLTVAAAVTVATEGAAAPLMAKLLGDAATASVATATIAGATGSLAGNMTSNAMNDRPLTEGNTQAAIYGGVGGAVLQTAANLGGAFMQGWSGGGASARTIAQVPDMEGPVSGNGAASTLDDFSPAANTTKEIRTRPTKGADGGTSEHIIERDASGEVISKTHRVTTDGEVVHQHQDHQGKYGGERRFPDEWKEYSTVDAPEHTPRPSKDNSITE